jgi:hypothetical protein
MKALSLMSLKNSMRLLVLIFIFTTIWANIHAQNVSNELPMMHKKISMLTNKDWLVDTAGFKATLIRESDKNLIFSNGLLARSFVIKPDLATVGLRNLMTGESLVRSVRPEASVTINEIDFEIGGLYGQPIHNYLLPEWLDEMTAQNGNFHFVDYSVGPIQERFPWKKREEWMPTDLPWPPKGKELTLEFKLGDPDIESAIKKAEVSNQTNLEYLRDITVKVHYNLYDHIPLICKWISVENNSNETITINKFKSEILAVTDPESAIDQPDNWRKSKLYVESDYAFGDGMSPASCLGKSVFWNKDPLYKTQVNYPLEAPYLLECYPTYGPEQEVLPGESFESFRTWELAHKDYDQERQGLERRKMYRTIAPWVTENPILMHVRQADDKSVKTAIDQCAEVGFEMVIMTFGSGFNLEDQSEKNLNRMKALADYAHSKGIALGGYSLLASRSINKENDVIMPDGQSPTFGNSPCLESSWGNEYFDKMYNFYESTGMDILEHDGSYPGDPCISENHPGHKGLEDSQWNQRKKITDYYKWCRANGIYLNVPDWYFLNGSNKTGMGYRETNWSLPRKQQEIIERQNVYDGTWNKTPSMGWMFVPLVQYHGGGKEATIEPLKDHLPHYEQRLANLFGAGVQACYRGPRLFDAPETKAIVDKWVGFYKDHRAILDSDVIHIRRPDGQDYDGILHVNPALEEKGLLMLYNPLEMAIQKTIKIPLYYTGLSDEVNISHEGKDEDTYKLNRDYTIDIEVEIPARSQTWYVIK